MPFNGLAPKNFVIHQSSLHHWDSRITVVLDSRITVVLDTTQIYNQELGYQIRNTKKNLKRGRKIAMSLLMIGLEETGQERGD